MVGRFDRFINEKQALLDSPDKPDLEELERLIEEAKALCAPSSRAQLERYRDHYYPEVKQ